MGPYLKFFLKGIFSKNFWADRLEDSRRLVSHPGSYFEALGKKENTERAYLLGMSATFLAWVALAVVSILTFGILSFGRALLFLPIFLLAELVFWIIGLYLLYYPVSWSFAIVFKWISGRYEIEKVRPILFAIGVSSLTMVVPGIGSLISLGLFLVLLVIAYEKALRVERGPAVGSAVLGALFSMVVLGLPMGLLGMLVSALFIGSLSLPGLGLVAALFHRPTYADHAYEKEQAPVSDGYTSKSVDVYAAMPEDQKIKAAAEVFRQGLILSIKGYAGFTGQSQSNLMETADAVDLNAQELKKIYPDQEKMPPEVYRLAVEKIQDEDMPSLVKYFKDPEQGEKTIKTILSTYVMLGRMEENAAAGSGPAVSTAPAASAPETRVPRKHAGVESGLKTDRVETKNRTVKNIPVEKPAMSADAAGSIPSTAAPPVPTPTSEDAVGKAVEKAAGKAAGDALGDAAGKLLGF
jgi:hypothetical protein